MLMKTTLQPGTIPSPFFSPVLIAFAVSRKFCFFKERPSDKRMK